MKRMRFIVAIAAISIPPLMAAGSTVNGTAPAVQAQIIYNVLSMILIIFMFIVTLALLRLTISQHRMILKSRELYDQILRQQRREARHLQRKAERAVVERRPARELFMRLSDLMNKQQPYTDAELNREMLATMLGTNHRYIDEAIRACSTSISTNAFINNYRVDHAARMLSETDEPIALIAEMSGFANRTSFNEKFRERFKMTPSEFRRAAKK